MQTKINDNPENSKGFLLMIIGGVFIVLYYVFKYLDI